MPLSEEELRLLEQMERALVEEDPKFASTLRGTGLRSSARRRAIVAAVCFVLGVSVLMAGAVSEMYPVAIGGFVIMLIAATVCATAIRGQRHASNEPPAPTPGEEPHGFTLIHGSGRGRKSRRSQRQASGSFMERLEERWRKRREDGGFS
ncbi:MAG: DUF3040 domain-containing protein [Nocardioides sp.]